MTYQQAAAQKLKQLQEGLPPEWMIEQAANGKRRGDTLQLVQDHLSPNEQAITEANALELLRRLQQGDVSSQEVVTAFVHRAYVSHQYTNCLAASNCLAAQRRAHDLDSYLRTHGKPMGVLHGLPVSLMDRFHVGGLDSACGFAGWAGRTRNADDEGTLLRALRTLGAVVHCKTNVPMSLMLGETSNNVIGTTTNPYNASFSAGGACGGEGALLALHGSALGLGTDIAGSSRIPSAFCGLWALKCSEHRLPNDGLATVLTGLPLAMGSIGLMAREPDVLELSLKALLTSNLALSDPEVIPLPWRQADLDSIMRRKASPKEQDGRLTFAVMYDDGHVQPHPPIQRALAIVSDALRQSGYEVIEWKPPAHAPAVENLFKILGSTAAAEARAAIDSSGEPPIPQLAEWYQHEDMAPNTTTEFWSLCERRHQFRKEYKAHWNQVGETSTSGRAPDGVILPVAPSLAVRPGGFRYYGYSAIANVLDYPSGVFPVTFGDRQLDIQHSKLTPLNELDREVQEMYRPADAHGMPVSLQIMCPRFREEVVLSLMGAISESLMNAASS